MKTFIENIAAVSIAVISNVIAISIVFNIVF